MTINEPIRIAQIMGKLWAGGVEAVVFNYYRQIDRSKVQFDFFYDEDSTVEPPKDLIAMGARFYKVPPYQKLPKYVKELKKHFKVNNYKIVHSHINTLSVFPLFVAYSEHIPVRIAHNHSVPGGKKFSRSILKNILRCFARVFSTDYFACSEKTGRWMFGNKSFDKGMVFVVKNAIDWNVFSKDNVSGYEKNIEKYGLRNKFVIGHIGRLTYAKNHIFMIDLLEELLKREKNAVLLLIGGGEMYNSILSHAKLKGLNEKVIFVGQVENPQDYYNLINVMIVPSFFEGLSLTTIESQISGVPVVVSDAIPDEAIISDACVRLSLSDEKSKWVDTIINYKGKNVNLDDTSKDYDIQNAAIKLTNWYLDKWKVCMELEK